MKIERAVREQTFTLTSIAGPSGAGKTYSALLYARGLVGPKGKIGFIDTENKRSRFYADVAGGFDVIDLDPPFTSARYLEAIKSFEEAGYKAIIVDSVSHEWEGTGGVLEQAEGIEQKTGRAGLHCWQKPKAGHKKMMNGLLQTSAHLIFCCRVKEKVTQVKVNGKAEIVNEGFVVVQEKSFIYEMTVSMMLTEGSHLPIIQKCPGDLLAAFPQDKKITPDVGGAVRAWSEQGREIDQELESAKREGLTAANEGLNNLMEWWKNLPKNQQVRLEGMKETFKSIARAADQIRSDLMDAGGGDPGERLQQARTATQDSQDEQEGFDLDHVSRETETRASDNQSDAGQSRSGADASPECPPADAEGDENPSQPRSSPSTITEADSSRVDASDEGGGNPPSPPSATLMEFAGICYRIVADKEYPTDMDTFMDAVNGFGFKQKAPEEYEKAETIVRSYRAVINDKTSLESASEFLAEMLGCAVEDFEKKEGE